jgi:hypothetical protein
MVTIQFSWSATCGWDASGTRFITWACEGGTLETVLEQLCPPSGTRLVRLLLPGAYAPGFPNVAASRLSDCDHVICQELLAGYLRLSTYAINAFKSSGGRSMGGMPPAFIFAVGCLKSSASWSGENFAPMPISAGAAAVPIPESPWHALQLCASKTVFPFAASGSASVTFAAAREAEESSGSNGLRAYSSSSAFCFANC